MGAIAQLLIRITADATGVARGTAAASASLRTLEGRVAATSRRMQTMGASLTSFGRGATRWLTRPLLLMGGAAAKMSVDFDTAMTKIEALVGASKKQMAEYRAEIFKLSGDLPITAKALGDTLYFIVSSGFEGKGALDALTASAKASAAGLGEAATIADAVTSAVTAYGKEALSAGLATDIMLNAVKVGKNEPEDLAMSIGRVIPLSSEMGISFDQVAAAMAAMSLKGTDAAEGSTALVAILNSFLDPATQTVDRLAEIGMTADDVRKSLTERGLLPTLIHLKDSLGDNYEALGDLFPRVRGLKGFLALTGASAAENVEIFDELADSVGATDEALKKAREGSGFKFKQAMAELAEAGIKMGDAMMPALLDLADTIKGLAKWFSNLPPAMQSSIVKWGALLLVLGPVARLLGSILTTGGKLIGLLPRLAAAVSGARVAGGTGAAAGGLGAAGLTPLLLNPWTVAVGGVAGALLLMKQNTDETRGATEALIDVVKSGTDAMEDYIAAIPEDTPNFGGFLAIPKTILGGFGIIDTPDEQRDKAVADAAAEMTKEIDEQIKSVSLLPGALDKGRIALLENAKAQFTAAMLAEDFTEAQQRYTLIQEILTDREDKATAALVRKSKKLIGASHETDRLKEATKRAVEAGKEDLREAQKRGRQLGENADETGRFADQVDILRDRINGLPPGKNIDIRADTGPARRALTALVQEFNHTRLTMDIGYTTAPVPTPTQYIKPPEEDAGGFYRLPMNAGTYSFPFSKGFGLETVEFSGLNAGRGRMPSGSRGSGQTFVIKGATLRIIGLDRAVGDFVVETIDDSEDNYQRESAARGRK